jgi:hypothetical protein
VATPITLNNSGNSYTAMDGITLVNAPSISFGLAATDKNAETKYRLGIYSAKLFVDDKLASCFALDSLCYGNTRYVNACVDYGKWFLQDKPIQLLRKLPGNKLSIFSGSPSNGIVLLKDKQMHNITICVCDASGNTATIQCKVKYVESSAKEKSKWYSKFLQPNKKNSVSTANAEAIFNADCFYDTVAFDMHEEQASETNAASTLIYLHNASVPVHDSYTVKIKTNLSTNSRLKEHTVMQLKNDKHSFVAKGQWDGDFMKASFDELGTAQLVIDTIAPDIQCKEGDNAHFTADNNALHIMYKDNLGSAVSFRGEIDGHWVLFEKKGDLFTYRFDEYCKVGRHKLVVTVADVAGNVTSRAFKFEKE